MLSSRSFCWKTPFRCYASSVTSTVKDKVKTRAAPESVASAAPVFLKRIYAAASVPLRMVSLAQLMQFGANLSESTLVRSAAFLHGELPHRLARQVAALDRLPNGLTMMPAIRDLRRNYVRSFTEIADAPPPSTFEQCRAFTAVLESVIQRHGQQKSQVALGMLQLRRELAAHHDASELDVFFLSADLTQQLDIFYRTRIGARMLIGQHVALMRDFLGGDAARRDSVVGLIHRHCAPVDVARDAIDVATSICRDATGVAPEVTVEGAQELTFPYVPSFLEYILTELLKNSMRATVEYWAGEGELPPIRVIVAHSADHEDVAIKVSDQGGGIPRSHMEHVFSYLYSTAKVDTEALLSNLDNSASAAAPLAGLGYGLPLARQHARYLGGDLVLASLNGYGTDAFVYMRRLTPESEAQSKATL